LSISEEAHLATKQDSSKRRGSAASSITVAELRERYLREKWTTFETGLRFIATKTSVIPIDRQNPIASGRINYENKRKIKNWGMADYIILATARAFAAKVVTGDPHFKGLKEAIMV